jgi:hypothetical protein
MNLLVVSNGQSRIQLYTKYKSNSDYMQTTFNFKCVSPCMTSYYVYLRHATSVHTQYNTTVTDSKFVTSTRIHNGHNLLHFYYLILNTGTETRSVITTTTTTTTTTTATRISVITVLLSVIRFWWHHLQWQFLPLLLT